MQKYQMSDKIVLNQFPMSPQEDILDQNMSDLAWMQFWSNFKVDL